MTVIQPNKTKENLFKLIFILGSVLLAVAGTEASIYSSTVSVKNQLQTVEDRISEIQLRNSDLQNQLYSLTSQENLGKLAQKEGLIKDNNPQWVFASQY